MYSVGCDKCIKGSWLCFVFLMFVLYQMQAAIGSQMSECSNGALWENLGKLKISRVKLK